jgi:hypothetical protein
MIVKGVSEAAAVLDIEKPGWEKQINLVTLNMASCDHCILGQLYGHGLSRNFFDSGYHIGLVTLHPKYYFASPSPWSVSPFSSDQPERDWVVEINARLAAAKEVAQPEPELELELV